MTAIAGAARAHCRSRARGAAKTRTIMPGKRSLTVIDEPTSRPVIAPAMPEPAFIGEHPNAPDLCCGACGHVLATKMMRRDIADVVIKCFACAAYNDTRRHPERN
jgi:hypothetical protein